jgi:hypothetical protein
MSFNGSGTFLINTAGQPVVAGTVISSTAFNALTADLATGLSTVITKDGQTTVTANIPMSTYKFTGLGVGSAAGDSANLSQVQSTVTKLLTSVSGTDTITAVGAPVVAAYAAGQMFYFVATGDNTGAVTLNIDSLGAKAVTRDGSVALAAGDIKSGEVVVVVYDGTRFQVVSQLNSAGNATFANVSITSALNVGGVATFAAGSAAAPSITTTGDTNTGIFFPAADTIAFTEGGVEAARFDSSGNLGIGTSSPGFRLDVAGNIRALNSGADSQVLVVAPSDSFSPFIRWGVSGIRDSGILGFPAGDDALVYRSGANSFSTGTERFRITVAGNVGIGTSSPGTILDLGTSTGQKISVYRNANIRYGFGIETDTMRYYVPTGASNAVHSFGQISTTDGTTYTERMRLDSSGNLGIGTSSPGAKLEVYGGGTGTVTNAQIGNASTAFVLGVDSGNNCQVRTAQNVPIIFYTNNTERARITSGGDLLVGTTNTSATAGEGFKSVFPIAAVPSVRSVGNNSTSSYSTYEVYSTSAAAYRFYVDYAGTVFATTTTISAISDQRFKENIQDIDVGLNAVMALKPRKFDWKAGKGKDIKNDRGFIAQEFEQVFPDLIDEWKDPAPEGEEPYKSVRQDLIPVLVKAIQELTARVAQLESK